MTYTFLGLGLLFGIVLLQWASRYWKLARLKRNWTAGQEALTRGDLESAEAAIQTCVRLAPVSAGLQRVLGNVLARQGRLDEAEKRLRLGADLEPRNAAGHLDLGFFFALCFPDKQREVIDAFTAAVSCDGRLRKTLLEHPHLQLLRQDSRFTELLRQDAQSADSGT